MLAILLMHGAVAGQLPPVASIEDLTAAADAVCVVSIVATAPGPTDPRARGRAMVATWEDAMSLEGTCPSSGKLRYLAYDHRFSPVICCGPRTLKPESGKSYLLFVEAEHDTDTFRLTEARLPAADSSGLFEVDAHAPIEGDTVRDVVWSWVTTGLNTSEPETVARSVRWANQLSFPLQDPYVLPEFDRRKTTRLVVSVLPREDAGVREAVLEFLTTTSPVGRDAELVHRLEAMRPGTFPGVGPADLEVVHWVAKDHFQAVVALAERTEADDRAHALRALSGHARGLFPQLDGWLSDPDPGVRVAATLLLADVPRRKRTERLATAAEDANASVRAAAARAAALAQDPSALPVVDALLDDTDEAVRRDAVRAVLSLGVAADPVMQRHVDLPEYGGLLVNALATRDATAWVARLGQQVLERYRPRFWSGLPAYSHSWKLLLAHLAGLEAAALDTDATAEAFDALEQGELERSDIEALYRLYVTKGLATRAEAFRSRMEAERRGTTTTFQRVDRDLAQP